MKDLSLYLWDISVALGIFGYGLIGTRLLGLRRSSLAVAGVFGVSLWIALGGVLNLLHLLRPAVFFTLVASGCGLLVVELVLRSREPRITTPPNPQPPSSRLTGIATKLTVAAAVLLILTLVVGAMRIRRWSVDDLQGYLALSLKAAQNHSLQPDPFSQRRVNASMGGGNFLDALMFATGDLHALNFIDSGFGFALYALAVWTVGRRWKVPPLGVAFTVLCLPLAPLVKVNLTIVCISAASFLALLLLLSEVPDPDAPDGANRADTRPFTTGRIIALGIIIGALIATKTPNIVFALPILLGVVLLHRLFQAKHSPLLPLIYALLVALATLLPWCIASKTIAGTYFYPLLGPGNHVSAYHLIWPEAKTGSWQQLVVLAIPHLTLLPLCFAVAWNLTRNWTTAARSAVLAYIGAAVLALPVYLYGVGCEDGDRYTAPLVMPIYLLTLLLVLGAPKHVPAFWRCAGVLTLLAAGLYTVLFIDIHLMYLFPTKTVLYEAFGKLPTHKPPYIYLLEDADIQREFAYGAKIQNSIPAGTTALDISFSSYHYNFRRNTILTADFPGMASPAPGLPLDSPAAVQRQFLIDHGVDYLILERDNDMSCSYNTVLQLGNADWPRFLQDQRQHFTFRYMLTHQTFTHSYGGWNIVEFFVPCHEQTVFQQIADTSPQVYSDSKFVVARLH